MHGKRWRLLRCLALMALGLLWGACSDDGGSDPVDAGSDLAQDQGPGGDAQADTSPDGAPASSRLIILHTNDMHSHLLGWAPNRDYSPATTGDDSTVGGMARLAALIKAERQKAGNTPVLLLDAGDFLMGSAFDWLNTAQVPMLSLMHDMGYDATCIGNHELDWKPAGLAAVLQAAQKAGATVPILASNITFDDTSADDDALAALEQSGVIKRKLVLELSGGLKVGLIGILGKAARDVAFGASPVTFADAAKAAEPLVKELREQDKVDLVIAVAHAGAYADGSGDSAALAKAVPGIDVVISGHTHTPISEAVKVGDTLVVEAGSHTSHLGRLELDLDQATPQLASYKLLAVDDTVAGDAATESTIDGYVGAIDSALSAAGLSVTMKTDVAQADFDLTFPPLQETNLGNLVTDAYRAAVDTAQPGETTTVAVESGGVIADPVLKGQSGKLWFADLYRAVPKGIGPDQKPGYPLVTFYLTGKDLKAGLELLPLSKDLLKSNDYFLQLSGIKVQLSSSGTLFDKVTSITTTGSSPQTIDINDSSTCYKVATSLLVGAQLSKVSSLTGGMLKVVPKEKDCSTVITDMTSRIVDADPAAAGVQEIKSWMALYSYVAAMPDSNSDQLPDLPSSYAAPEGRIEWK